MKIFILFALFNIILSIEQDIECFTQMTIWPKNNDMYYNFQKTIQKDDFDIYFYFRIYSSWDDDIFKLKIIDEEQNEVVIDNITNKNVTWISYKLANLESQKYTIKITCKNFGELYFIDSSREINTKLENFINLDFRTDLIGDLSPLPLIFNIDTVQKLFQNIFL